MNQSRLTLYGIIAAAVLVVASQTFYVVDQTHQALVIRVGEIVRVVNAPGADDGPGLKVKIPFFESRILFDKRNLTQETTEEEITAGNKERLVVDAFLRYRISDPQRFYTALGDSKTAEARLEQRLNAALREQLGTADSEEIISSKRGALMAATRANLARQAQTSRLGIEVIDVRIRRADLPAANQTAVFERMRTARLQEATRIRAEGEQKRKEIVAAATGEAETIRGEGDAERAKLFASSFGKDPNFASFYRSMQAYEASMGQGDATLVLSPDSAFFKYFGRGPGAN
ncbi:protease modulator HflC [Caulobacter mirabilis]|uniref:Protein HflC n=1 Tax=Caulobacter mirabilis TaxID=69666 RepID=A0A2D2AWK0_9CAUL|nr:protease modulator HflC [Caulobacter mirabilis]ATQ42327.1 protease modulator HflC [Caulobacter mirabilis]